MKVWPDRGVGGLVLVAWLINWKSCLNECPQLMKAWPDRGAGGAVLVVLVDQLEVLPE